MSLRQWLHGLSTRPTDETVQPLRQGWLRHHLEVLRQDLHYDLRVIRRSGPLSGAVVLTLLVGLGMNSVVFSVLNGLLFRSSATRDPDTFIQVYAQPSGQSRRESHGPETMVTLEDFYAIRSATRTLSAVTVSRWATFTLGAADGVPLRGKFVSCNFLSAHIGPLKVGRGLVESDCSARGGEPVVVLTERAWNLHFARDSSVVGRAIRLNDTLLSVIGVAPDDAVDGPIAAMAYVPYTMQPVLQGPTDYFRGAQGIHAWLNLSGRLAPGRTIREAQAELDVIESSVDRLHPGQLTGMLVTDGAIIHEPNTARTMPLLVVLCLGAGVLILLMVCANVTTLLLARAVSRRHEMAVRISLGASRSRLRRQLLTETITLAACAGLGSIALAYYAPRYVAQLLSDFPLLNGFRPDWRVFAFTFVLASVAACLAGVSPALETLRFDLVTALKPAGHGGRAPVSSSLRSTLIANQLSISLTLLVVMGVVFRAQGRLINVTFDYDPNRTIVTDVDLSHSGYTGPSARAFYDRLIPSLQEMPRVHAVALASPPPFRGIPRTSFSLENAARRTLVASVRCVTPAYFPITGLRVVSGRLFSDLEAGTPGRVMPIVVSDSFARKFFPSVEAVGQRIRFANDDVARIVAVVSDTSSIRPAEADEPMLYQPIYTADVASISPILQVDGDARPLIPSIRAQVQMIDRKLSPQPKTVAMLVAGEASRYNAVLGAAAIPATLALFLSVIGIYGLTAFAAAQRIHEIGVRIALGASRRQIIAVFFQSLRGPFVVGIVVGSACAAIGVSLLKSAYLLTDASAAEPLPYAIGIVLLLLTASVATVIPAARTTRKEPWSTLRDY